MNLTEGQLFTIEALNRIEGFVWPEGAKFATFDRGYTDVNFWTGKPTANNPKFFGPLASSAHVKAYHPDWRNSLITSEQFDSVDGWVRHDNTECPANSELQVQVKMHGLQAGKPNRTRIAKGWVWVNGGITHWRYHKPTKETEMKDAEQFQPTIHETYYRYKKQRETTDDARKALEASMEAEDKLLEQIKAWNLEYGFDIRVLDESDEKPEPESNKDPEPELVITDWRDLRVGDVVSWSVINGSEMKIISVHHDKSREIGDFEIEDESGSVFRAYGDEIEFIRRPSK